MVSSFVEILENDGTQFRYSIVIKVVPQNSWVLNLWISLLLAAFLSVIMWNTY